VCKIKKNSDMILEMLEKLYDVDDGNWIYKGRIKGIVKLIGEMGIRCKEYKKKED
jgi:hypothetical protein